MRSEGVAPNPALRPEGGERIRQRTTGTRRGQRVPGTVVPERYAHKYANKGGLTYLRTNATPGATPQRCFPRRDRTGTAPRAGTPGETAIRVGGAPFPDPPTAVIVEDGQLVRVTVVIVVQGRRTGQRSEGVVCSRRCSTRCGSRSRTLPPGALESARTSRRCPLGLGTAGPSKKWPQM